VQELRLAARVGEPGGRRGSGPGFASWLGAETTSRVVRSAIS